MSSAPPVPPAPDSPAGRDQPEYWEIIRDQEEGPRPTLGHRLSGAQRLSALTLLCLLSAAICALALVAIGRAAVGTARGQRLDQLVLTAAQTDTGLLSRVVFPVLNSVSVPVVLALLAGGAIVALLRRRYGTLAQMAVLVGGATMTTQIVKHLLVERSTLAEAIEQTPNSFPSGHTTLAASVALALVLASPPHLRGLVALIGSLWASGAGIGTMAGGWHRPSDVVGAFLVTGFWAFLVLGADALIGRHRPPHPHLEGSGPQALPGDDGAGASAPQELPADGGASSSVFLAVFGLAIGIAGAIGLTLLPTPLILTSASQQSSAYAGSSMVITGAMALLTAAVLALRMPRPLSRMPR